MKVLKAGKGWGGEQVGTKDMERERRGEKGSGENRGRFGNLSSDRRVDVMNVMLLAARLKEKGRGVGLTD